MTNTRDKMAKRIVLAASPYPLRQFDRMSADNEAKRRRQPLASYELLDNYSLMGKIPYGCFARQFLAYPASEGSFPRHGDIRDPETGTSIPLSILKEALDGEMYRIYGPGIGLLIDPEKIDTCGRSGSMVIIPKTAKILGTGENPFIQEGGRWVGGIADEETRVPLAVSEEKWEELPVENRRYLYRVPEQGIRPLVRGGAPDTWGGLVAMAIDLPWINRALAFEEYILPKELIEYLGRMIVSREGSGKLVLGGTPEQIDAAFSLLGQVNGK